MVPAIRRVAIKSGNGRFGQLPIEHGGDPLVDIVPADPLSFKRIDDRLEFMMGFGYIVVFGGWQGKR